MDHGVNQEGIIMVVIEIEFVKTPLGESVKFWKGKGFKQVDVKNAFEEMERLSKYYKEDVYFRVREGGS